MNRRRGLPKLPKHLIELGCMNWHGNTKTEAAANRDAELSSYFEAGKEVPTIIAAGRFIGVVFYRFTGDYSYQLIEDGKPWSIHGGPWDRRAAERACRRHLAQALTRLEGDVIVEDGLAVIDPADADDHKRWLRFQVEHARAVAAGASSIEAHRLALTAVG